MIIQPLKLKSLYLQNFQKKEEKKRKNGRNKQKEANPKKSKR